MNRIEYGDRALRSSAGSYPPEWGVPVGDPLSEERREWVKARVQAHNRLKPVRQLVQRQQEMSRLLGGEDA
jgi:hypothetical protein